MTTVRIVTPYGIEPTGIHRVRNLRYAGGDDLPVVLLRELNGHELQALLQDLLPYEGLRYDYPIFWSILRGRLMQLDELSFGSAVLRIT